MDLAKVSCIGFMRLRFFLSSAKDQGLEELDGVKSCGGVVESVRSAPPREASALGGGVHRYDRR